MLDNILNTTCTIEQQTHTQAANGSAAYSYAVKHSNIATSVKQLRAANTDNFKSETPTYTTRFYFDYDAASDVSETDRILYNGSYYYIDTVYDVAGKNKILQIDGRLTK